MKVDLAEETGQEYFLDPQEISDEMRCPCVKT